MAAKTISSLLAIFVFSFCTGTCLSQFLGSKTNLEILEQNISAELEKFFYYPDVNRELQFVFYVESPVKDKSEKKFIEQLVRKTAERNKLRFSISKDEAMASSDSAFYRAKIVITRLRTLYPRFSRNQFLGDKTMEREITSDLEVEIKLNDGTNLVKDDIKTVFKGDIPYDDYSKFESEEYAFTQSEPPDVSSLETIFFPAAIVVISAVATILFFSIRSK